MLRFVGGSPLTLGGAQRPGLRVKSGSVSTFLNDTLNGTAGDDLNTRAGWRTVSGSAFFDNASPAAVMFTASPTLYVQDDDLPASPTYDVTADYVVVTKITSNFSRLYIHYDEATDSDRKSVV